MPVGWMSWLPAATAGDPAKPRGIAKRRIAAKRARKARRRSR